MKRGGAAAYEPASENAGVTNGAWQPSSQDELAAAVKNLKWSVNHEPDNEELRLVLQRLQRLQRLQGSGTAAGVGFHNPESDTISLSKTYGGSKRKSRKSRKTKKGRGSHEGGKKKCPKHCRRHTRRTRKGLKHHKN